MKPRAIYLLILMFFSGRGFSVSAQLSINVNSNANELAQKLVGDGLTISNASFTGHAEMAGFFNNRGGTNISIDSGIVLTNGRSSARAPRNGLVGNSGWLANNPMAQPGDADLSGIIGLVTNDACVLQFDFIPQGDSIKFNYVFSSEEYPDFVCVFNDAFAFLISGPGIPGGTQNIALIPNTNLPVTIDNINDRVGCGIFPQYYISNAGNPFFTHNGHTTVLTAVARVIPCQTYTLKLVIADAVDFEYDSGVFLQAKSLTSNAVAMSNQALTDPSGNSYLAEGCDSRTFEVRRPRKESTPLIVNLAYGGTAINGVDVQLLPTQAIIPANDSFVRVTVVPVQDGLDEGIEDLKIYALAGCILATPADSTIVQIRDYDILALTPDTAIICRNGTVQLLADPGYSSYQWNTDATLSSTTIHNPVASPVNNNTTYTCTATTGTCSARDSAFVRLKSILLLSKRDVNCSGASTGAISVAGSADWIAPVQYSLDGTSWQPTGDFANLPAGNYFVKVRDGGCTDSIPVTIVQAFPDLVVDNIASTAASCSGNPDGQLSITVSGGNTPYAYSTDGINFQPSNIFNLTGGNYTITIKDNNGCLATEAATVILDNTVTIDAGDETSICEGTSYSIPAVSNATTFAWTSTGAMTGQNNLTPVASPATTTWYYVTATTGVCSRTDSVRIVVRPAPVADAGDDFSICFGKIFQLNGAGGVAYQWSPSTYFTTAADIPSPSVKATQSIIYNLTVWDATGCQSLTADPVRVTVTPSVRIFAGTDTIAAINQPIQLQVIETGSSGVTQYTWSPSAYLSDATIDNPVATLPHDQRYVVTGATADGCEGTDDILIKVYKGPEIYVASAFTPNNDGLNDELKPVPVGMKELHYFRVYNRWGQLVFSTQNASRGWDGRIKGIVQLTSTYVWMAEGTDYNGRLITRKGTVTLIR
jgi:gliding motility-associated-like protein